MKKPPDPSLLPSPSRKSRSASHPNCGHYGLNRSICASLSSFSLFCSESSQPFANPSKSALFLHRSAALIHEHRFFSPILHALKIGLRALRLRIHGPIETLMNEGYKPQASEATPSPFLSTLQSDSWSKERIDDAQSCGSTLTFYAADRIHVSSEILQPCYSHGTQVSLLFSGYVICLLPFECARFCSGTCNLRFMSVLISFGDLDTQLQTLTMKIPHDLASWGLLCINFSVYKSLLKVFTQLLVSDFVHSDYVQILLSMVCLRPYSCYHLLKLLSIFFMDLCIEYGHGLFMVRGHKVATLWPKASPLNESYGSFESILSWSLLCTALEPLSFAGFHPAYLSKVYHQAMALILDAYYFAGIRASVYAFIHLWIVVDFTIYNGWLKGVLAELRPLVSLSPKQGLDCVLASYSVLDPCHPYFGGRRIWSLCFPSASQCYLGHADVAGIYAARTMSPWQLDCPSLYPLRAYVQDDNNFKLLLTETTTILFLFSPCLKSVICWFQLMYTYFQLVLYSYLLSCCGAGYEPVWSTYSLCRTPSSHSPSCRSHLYGPSATRYRASVALVLWDLYAPSDAMVCRGDCSLSICLCKYWLRTSYVLFMHQSPLRRNIVLVSGIKPCCFFPKTFLPTDPLDH